MRTSLHDVWGCGRGAAARLAPPTRLLAGAAVFVAVMVAPAATLRGSLLVVAAAGAWLAVCGPPSRVTRMTLVLGVVVFLPYFLLLPWIPAAAGGWRHALGVPWTILLRGIGGMIVSVATVAALSPTDLREALMRLPVPSAVSAILLQIVHQTGTLYHETRGVAAALAVRGALSRGLRSWRVLAALPQVWLPRVIGRAERVAAAMELRGYCEAGEARYGRTRIGLADGAALLAAGAAVAAAVALRVGGGV